MNSVVFLAELHMSCCLLRCRLGKAGSATNDSGGLIAATAAHDGVCLCLVSVVVCVVSGNGLSILDRGLRNICACISIEYQLGRVQNLGTFFINNPCPRAERAIFAYSCSLSYRMEG